MVIFSRMLSDTRLIHTTRPVFLSDTSSTWKMSSSVVWDSFVSVVIQILYKAYKGLKDGRSVLLFSSIPYLCVTSVVDVVKKRFLRYACRTDNAGVTARGQKACCLSPRINAMPAAPRRHFGEGRGPPSGGRLSFPFATSERDLQVSTLHTWSWITAWCWKRFATFAASSRELHRPVTPRLVFGRSRFEPGQVTSYPNTKYGFPQSLQTDSRITHTLK